MKTQNKNSKGLYLQKRNKRWKWMAGATAAGMTASQAGAITINLLNNYISVFGGNHLNADLTGDGHPDLTIANAFTRAHFRTSSHPGLSGTFDAGVNLNGVPAYAHSHNRNIPNSGFVQLGSRWASWRQWTGWPYVPTSGTSQLTGSIPIFFKDLHINGGAPTMGSLEVTVLERGPEIQLDSFTYNDASFHAVSDRGSSLASVPDQGSSLALLAMGAGGILAFRRWKAVQGRS